MGPLPILPTIQSVLESLMVSNTPSPATSRYIHPARPAPPTPTHSRPVSIPPPAPMPPSPYEEIDRDPPAGPAPLGVGMGYAQIQHTHMTQHMAAAACCNFHPYPPPPHAAYPPAYAYPAYAHHQQHQQGEKESQLRRLVSTSIYLLFLFLSVVVYPLVVRGVRWGQELDAKYGESVRKVLAKRNVELKKVEWGWVGREVVGGTLEGFRRGWEVWCE